MSDGIFASEHVSLFLDDVEYEVARLEGDEAVCAPFTYRLAAQGPEDTPAAGDLIGVEARVVLRDGRDHERTIRGLVGEVSRRFFEIGAPILDVVVVPAVAVLDTGRDCRVYQDKTVVEIVQDVFDRAGIDAHFDIHATYHPRTYTVQYRESDWCFVHRLLEEEGLYYWFDHERESAIVFADSSATAADLVGGAEIPFVVESGMTRGGERIFELGREQRVVPDRFVVRSFDPDRPALAVEGAAGEGPREVYDARGGGPTEPAAAEAHARVRHEHALHEAERVRGASTSVRLVPGRRLTVSGHVHDGDYFVVSSKTVVSQRQRDDGGTSSKAPKSTFVAGLVERPYRPAEVTPWPTHAGLHVGTVAGAPGEEVWPDERGRVRVQLAWDRVGQRDDKAGTWIRVNQRGTGESMMLPRMGWNVFTMSEEGSVDRPIVLHRFFDAEHPPPYALPANKTRIAFRTATTPSQALLSRGVGAGLSFPVADATGGFGFNEIRFENREGNEEMFWNASRDLEVLVQNDKGEQIKRDHLHQVVHDHSLDIKNDSAETVVGDQTIHIEGDESESVGMSTSKTVNGDETNVIGVSRSLDVGNSTNLEVTGTRNLTVGAVQMDVSLGTINAMAPAYHKLVGGAVVKASAYPITETVGMTLSYGGINGPAVGGVIQTIGGAKIEATAAHRAIKADRNIVETVGGVLSHVAMTEVEDAATGPHSTNVGAGLVGLGVSEVAMEGEVSVSLVCGASKITLDAKGVTFDSPKISLSGGMGLVAGGGPNVEHNA